MYKFPSLNKFRKFVDRDNWLQRVRNFSFLIGEGALDLVVNLIVMIMVERSLGEVGLGVFAYLLSISMFAGFISEFGISRYLEREIAVIKGGKAKTQAIEKALYAMLVTSIICAVLFFITAVFDTTHTRVEEKVAAYFIIGITIPLRNLNRIRIAILQGSGRFDITAALKTRKRIFLLGAVFLLLLLKTPPSYLMVGYFVSELELMMKSRKTIKLPGFKTIWNKQSTIRSTLKQSRCFLLTDEALDIVLYMDFLILGIFVSSWDLGLYAEASILARIFLFVPISIKPVFREQYCSLAAKNRLENAAVSIQVSTALLFFLHSVLALYILLYFSEITQSLYHAQGKSMVSFYVFVEILPGLLFFSSVTSQEPVYEAEEKIAFLQKTVILIALLNFTLNCFFIPFAGIFGAAFATSTSMFVYFILFGKPLNPIFHINKIKYIIAGAAVYLTYMFFQKLDLNFVMAFFLVPAFVFVCFLVINFFNFEFGQSNPKPGFVLPENIK